VQYGFLGILLTVLIWYSRKAYAENVRRDKVAEIEKKELIDRYEIEKRDIIQRYEDNLRAERGRYHETHQELLALMNLKLKKND
jgi:hypothetical protein